MSDILKFLWVSMAIFCIFALVASLPVKKYQKGFRHFLAKQKYAPQARINAAQRYMDAYERGEISEVYQFGYAPEFMEYYHKELNIQSNIVGFESNNSRRYTRPLYIRDINNPNILYPYSERLDEMFSSP